MAAPCGAQELSGVCNQDPSPTLPPPERGSEPPPHRVAVEVPAAAPVPARRILGSLLLESGLLQPAALALALQEQRRTGERLGEAIIRLESSTEADVYRTLATQLGLPFDPGPLHMEPVAVALIGQVFARRKAVLPLRLSGRALCIAVGDPLDLSIVDDVQFQTGKRVEVTVAPPSALREALGRAYEQGEYATLANSLPARTRTAGGSPVHSAEEEVADAPAVRLVDLLVRRAVEAGASDLHVEQESDELLVRERVDGVLRRVTELPPGTRNVLLSRIKVLAGMDIAVKRRPQDGGFPITLGGRTISVRVSTLPVEGGEKAVLRFLDPTAAPRDLEAVGLAADDLARVRALSRGGRGVILAAGPTGSGKSSTLFGALGELNRPSVNIVTIEDPIEYRVSGVSQVQVHPKSGLTFPAALRAILRQDPDIIMVGEIRDRETAEIAMAAAITGHLVLSTIHTVDAPSGVSRLLQMGVPPHLVAGGLAGIVAQRLVRRACLPCAGHPGGCASCREGYRGRTGVFQVLAVTEAIREAIGRGAEASEIRRRAEEAGMGTMADDARRKASEGITTLHEVARVLREDPGEALPCRRCGAGVPFDGAGCPHCGQIRNVRCSCGRALREGWRYCPECIRKVPAPP